MILSVWALPATTQGIRSRPRAFAPSPRRWTRLERPTTRVGDLVGPASAGCGPPRRGTRPPQEGAHPPPDLRSGASTRWRGRAKRVVGPARGAGARQCEALRGARRPERGRTVAPAVQRLTPGRFPFCWALRLAPLVFVSLGELVTAEWFGIDLGRAERCYTVTKIDRLCGAHGVRRWQSSARVIPDGTTATSFRTRAIGTGSYR